MVSVLSEVIFKASRSSGAGGQNVNKVSSRVTLRFSVRDSNLFTAAEKALLLEKLGNLLTKEGELLVSCEQERSQLRNRGIALRKLEAVLADGLAVATLRMVTEPSASAVRARVADKRRQGEKKARRQASVVE
jgi:ribosome-associated protein